MPELATLALFFGAALVLAAMPGPGLFACMSVGTRNVRISDRPCGTSNKELTAARS